MPDLSWHCKADFGLRIKYGEEPVRNNKNMANLQDLINIAKADGGKFFVIDENGDAKLVIMSIEDYQHLLLGKLQRQVEDVENINKMITKAQLSEDQVPAVPQPTVRQVSSGPAVKQRHAIALPDLREEVIDPSFDFEGPKTDIDDI